MRFLMILMIFSVGLISLAPSAQGQPVFRDECTGIFKADLPLTITRQGTYCLAGNAGGLDLTSGAAITIAANNVVLDLNTHKLGNLGSGLATQAVGIQATDRKNITIKNGRILGFLFGISLRDTGASSGHLIENIEADRNRQIGIFIQGSGNIIRDNRVQDTGGSTNPDPGIGGIGLAVGILADGSGARVINNDVDTVTGTSIEAGTVGIAQQGGFAAPDMPAGSNAFFVNNRISGVHFGVIGSWPSEDEAGKCRDNLFTGVTNYTFGGCIDAGNNN